MHSEPNNHIIAATELKKLLDNAAAIVIDVRQPEEHKEERIEPSTLIPLGNISSLSLPDNPNNLPIVFYCRAGFRSYNALSLVAQEIAIGAAAPTQLYSLEGGIEAWKNMGFTVKKG